MTHASPRHAAARGPYDQHGASRIDEAANTVVRSPLAHALLHVEMLDISATGCRFVSDRPIPIGTPITLGLVGAGSAAGIVLRSDGDRHACRFDRPLSARDHERAFSGTVVFSLDGAICEPPAAHFAEHKLPLEARFRIIVALAILCWALPGLALALL